MDIDWSDGGDDDDSYDASLVAIFDILNAHCDVLSLQRCHFTVYYLKYGMSTDIYIRSMTQCGWAGGSPYVRHISSSNYTLCHKCSI